jgi:hypothetical protein
MNLLLTSTTLLALAVQLSAQPATAPPKTTGVLVILSVRPDVDRSSLLKTMPQEVRDTVQLYLDGKIQQWFGRSDGKGVVFILNCSSVADAKALTDTLPLSKAGIATFEYMPIGPLTPLRFLMGEAKP